MSKLNKKNRAKKRNPDEAFSFGPIRVGRFGNQVVWESNWDRAEHEKHVREMADGLPAIVEEINEAVCEVKTIVAANRPQELLLRAFWTLVKENIGVEVESDVGIEHAHAMRMIDYIQSMIAAVPRTQEVSEKVTEEDWEKLNEAVRKIFNLVGSSYSIGLSCKNQIENPDYDPRQDEFLFKARMYWCNVRGKQFHYHQISTLRETLAQHSNQIEKVYGISSNQLVDELHKIWHNLTFGIFEAFESLHQFRDKTLSSLEQLGADGFKAETTEELMSEAMADAELRNEGTSAFGKAFGYDLFDLEKATKLPPKFLDDFSWKQGEESNFLAEGEFRGWPTKVWPTFRRPFIYIDGKYHCFDIHALFDHIYRQLEQQVFTHSQFLKNEWIETRKQTTESLPVKYLSKLLPNAKDFGEVYYRWKTGEKQKKNWCETDRLFVFDNVLFVIEVKAGAFTWTSPDDDFDAFVTSLRNLIEAPSKQGDRFIEYLESAEEVPIFDSAHEEIARVKRSDFASVIKCAITLDSFTEFAAQSQQLNSLNVVDGNTPTWSFSIDDMRVYSDIFENGMEFMHYVQIRYEALSSELLQLDDELDHLGLYLAHNNYPLHAQQIAGTSNPNLAFFGYRNSIDEFYVEKVRDEKVVSPLSQKMPQRLKEIIRKLDKSKLDGRLDVARHLLDLDGEWREKVFNVIDIELSVARQNGRTRPLSTYGDVRITLMPWLFLSVPRSIEVGVAHVKALIHMNGETDRLLLEPVYSEEGELILLTWNHFTKGDISDEELTEVGERAAKIKADRIRKVSKLGKIGANQKCPCGSGKKYKKCCR